MSVDKFGRHISVLHKEIVKGERGVGFKLTDDEHYDMENKILRNTSDPLLSSDAATKNYVDLNIPIKEDNVWKFKNRRLGDVANPLETSDVATKQYVDLTVPKENSEFWHFKGKRLSNVGDPVYDGESVNIRYLKKRSVHLDDDDNAFDIRSKRLKKVGEPIEEDDAVTLIFMKTQSNKSITQQHQKVRVMIKRLGIEIFKYISSKIELKSETEGPQNYINWDFVLNPLFETSTD